LRRAKAVQRKNLWWFIGAVIVLGIIVGILLIQKPTPEKQVVKIGAILPLTGRFAFMGEPLKKAMDLAVKQINSQDGGIAGKRAEILYADSQGDPKMGVSAAQKLIDVNNVKIITTFLTGVSEAVKPVTEEKRILLIAQTVSPTITKDAKYTIRMHYSFVKEGQLLSEHLLTVGQQPIGFIRSKDPSTSFEVEKIIIPRLREKGFTQIIDETFDVGNKDFKPHVLKMKTEGVKQIGLLGYGNDMLNLLKELKAAGLFSNVRICGNLGFVELPAETPNELSKEVVFTAPPYLIESQKTDAVKRFEEAYRAAYQAETISYSAYYAYDVLYLLKKAIEAARSDEVEELRRILSNESFELMTGIYKFSEDGDAHPPAVLATFKDGHISLFAPSGK